MSQKYYSQRESFPCLSVIKSKYRGEWGCILYMRDVRWRLVKCTSLEHRVWLLWNWQFAGLIERSVLLFCDLSYSLNLRSWREKVDDVSGRGPGVKTVFMRDVRWEAWAHVTQGDTDFNWYELVTSAGAASRLMPHQSPIKTPLSLIHPALHVTLTVTSLLYDSPARHDKYLLPRDLIIGQLELGEEDGAVLRAPAVDHWDDLVSPTHGSHQSQVLYWSLDRLKI